MKLKTYQAWTMAEALEFVKSDLGTDAVILHTRTFERGGFFGLGRRSVVEITAARSQDMPRIESRADSRASRVEPKPRPVAAGEAGDAHRMTAAARAYGIQSVPVGEPRANEPLDMESEREKTKRLAQAMAISLEKQAAARASATRNEEVVREVATRPAVTPKDEPKRETPAEGPARHFMLVNEANQSGGAVRLTAAVVRPPADLPDAPSASISPTHTSIPAVRPVVETKDVSAEPELAQISEVVGRVLKRSPVDPVAGVSRGGDCAVAAPAPASRRRPASIEAAHALLIEQEFGPELADRLIRELSRRFAEHDEPANEAVRAALLERIAAILPTDIGDAFEVEAGRHGARRIALVGPTGVGKTTTLAKIAAHLKLKRGLRVGIVAADTYRIAAVDQLRTYAEILDLPVEIASSPRDAARACESLRDVDVILIDTAGRSQNDHMKLSELKAFIASADPDETHLVLSATASMRTLAREAEAFGSVGVDRMILTKLDEAASFGALVTLVERLGKKLSFLTHGQEVPDHIEIARGRRLAALVLGSEVR